MDALIIAAGYGSRLREISESKPMTPVAGKPLIELGILQARAAGASRVVVVTGHEAGRLEAGLVEIAARTGVPVDPVRLADWSKPNGWSVMAGAEAIVGDFLLMMADHIFATPILARLAGQGSPARGVTLAIDRRVTHPLIDPEDATWVQTNERGFIQSIGKTIAPYNAVDCGAFLGTPELPKAIAAAIAAGKVGSLSDGMQALADQGRAATMDIGEDPQGAWWLDVDDPRAHAIAESEAPKFLPEIFGQAELRDISS